MSRDDRPHPSGSPSSQSRGRGGDRQGPQTPAALEEVHIQYLGRKAELPNLLRGVAQLPPEERAATGKAANQARQALERPWQSRRAASWLASAELDERLEQDRIDVTLPADPLPAIGRLRLMTRPGARSRTCSSGSASTSPRGRRWRPSTTTSTRSTMRRRTPPGSNRTRST